MSDQIREKNPGEEASFAKTDGGEIRPSEETEFVMPKAQTPIDTGDLRRLRRDVADQHHPSALKPSADDNEPEKTSDVGEGTKAANPKDQGLLVKLRAHPITATIGLVVVAAGVIGGILWYLNSRHYANTDDAFIDGRPISINLQVTGNIVLVPVTDNQIVKIGDLLVQIDDRDYRAAVDLALAQIDQAQATVDNFSAQVYAQESQIAQTETQVVQAQATLEFSKQQNTRYQDLVEKGAGTAQRAEQAASEFQANTAALATAQAAKMVAERQINVLKAQRKNAGAQLAQAEAQKAMADANLTRTQLHATADGRVTRLTAAVGQLATQAQSVMVLVPLDIWVTANFKETQLTDIKVGQAVVIGVDAFGRSFPGHVDSVQSGSGTAFSLLPAQNATGNYVKIVQRVPVKITFDQRPDVQLGPGMSVVPKVTIR
jgi:membrane fusion protein (multidrug efflux system)